MQKSFQVFEDYAVEIIRKSWNVLLFICHKIPSENHGNDLEIIINMLQWLLKGIKGCHERKQWEGVIKFQKIQVGSVRNN